MNTFFILGSHPALSIAELVSRFPAYRYSLAADNVLLADGDFGSASQLIRQLGGIIKIGRLVGRIAAKEAFEAAAAELAAAPKSGKFNFGISAYATSRLHVGDLGIKLKKELKEQGVSSRFVTSREKQLSSVVVEQNKLVSSGRELVFIGDKDAVWFGVTEAVQPFKELSRRDYGRPARDDHSGMLPPKLAQIMINLSACPLDGVLLDPFCGSGTILTEAMLMGYRNIYGSDLSAKAVADSKQNVSWTNRQADSKTDVIITQADATKLSRSLKPHSIDAVVTETYLGPQRGAHTISKTVSELASLYNSVFKQIATVLTPGGRAVIALPVFIQGHAKHFLNLALKPLRIVRLPAIVPSRSLTDRGTLLYGRPGQKVWREILIVQK